MVQIPTQKTSVFRRLSEDLTKLTVRGSRSDLESDSNVIKRTLSRRKSDDPAKRVAEVVQDDKIVKDVEKTNKENIPGLGGRDVVAIAILVDGEGAPMKTYTEHQDIPSDEYDAAKQVFISRVPCADPEENKRKNSTSPALSERLNIKPLADVLLDHIEVDQANKLKRRMCKVLIKLHTTDLETALSFLKVERYGKVRRDILNELVMFAERDLKMNVIIEEK